MAERRPDQRLIEAAARAARRHPTPFYLFDKERVRASLGAWREAAGGAVDLFYPAKCNRHPGLLALAARGGWGAEVTAREDLEAALGQTRVGHRVLFQGPAKDAGAIDAALSAGAWLAADGAADARAILDRARALGVAPRYLLRFRPAAAEPSQRRFGMSRAELLSLARRIVREGRPAPAGLAFHLGTGLSSLAPYLSAIRESGRIASALSGLGIVVRVLDAGGGFASRAESRRDAQGRPRGMGREPRGIVGALLAATQRALPGARLFLEPGRAVASDAFHLATRVIRVTPQRVYVDASRMSHAFFVPWGRHVFGAWPRRPGRGRVAIAGPLPVDLDVLSPREAIGRPREGDLLVIESVGAYNVIASNAWAGRIPQVVEVSASRGVRRSGGPTRR
jgi:diaminopimelate decarboxylase